MTANDVSVSSPYVSRSIILLNCTNHPKPPQTTPKYPINASINILTQAWATTFYNVFVKRNSAFVATILASAFVFDMTFETAIDNFWDRINAGVSINEIQGHSPSTE